ncbi:MAG: hypothetical protein AABZ05_07330, partial [Nitrospirota bacterium]
LFFKIERLVIDNNNINVTVAMSFMNDAAKLVFITYEKIAATRRKRRKKEMTRSSFLLLLIFRYKTYISANITSPIET